MKKYLGETGLKSVLGKLKGELGLKADKSDLTWHSNQNLLDNWYFLNPVNQRGQEEYTGGTGYTIDRWKFNVDRGTLTLSDGYVTLTNTAERGNQYLAQKIEPGFLKAGTTITYSAIIRGDRGTINICNFKGDIVFSSVELPLSEDWQLVSNTVTLSGELGQFIFNVSTNNGSNDIMAAKLELGPVQTLAHKEGDQWVLNDPPPNYQQELAKCQRYQVVYKYDGVTPLGVGFAASSSVVAFPVTTPVPMRVKPTISAFNGLYSFSSNHIGTSSIALTGIKNAIVGDNGKYSASFSTSGGLTVGEVTIVQIRDEDGYFILDANL